MRGSVTECSRACPNAFLVATSFPSAASRSLCRDLCLKSPVDLLDLNVSCRVFAVFRRRTEVKLRGPDVGVTGELLHLLNGRAVLQRIGDRGLSQRMHADAAATHAVRIETGFTCVPLDDFPNRGPIQVLADQ